VWRGEELSTRPGGKDLFPEEKSLLSDGRFKGGREGSSATSVSREGRRELLLEKGEVLSFSGGGGKGCGGRGGGA